MSTDYVSCAPHRFYWDIGFRACLRDERSDEGCVCSTWNMVDHTQSSELVTLCYAVSQIKKLNADATIYQYTIPRPNQNSRVGTK